MELLNCPLVAQHSFSHANFLINSPNCLSFSFFNTYFYRKKQQQTIPGPSRRGRGDSLSTDMQEEERGVVPPTAPFYLASADLFSSGRDELVTCCKSEDCELEMHLTHLPDTVGYNAECCPVWSFILKIGGGGLGLPHWPPLREGHTASS